MSRLFWTLGWIGVALWSLFCALAYGVLDIVGRLFMNNADSFSSDPNTVEGIWKVMSIVHSLSTGTVVVVWAVVALLILAVPWVIDRMVGPGVPLTIRTTGPAPAFGRDGVIDLSPDQYSVQPPPQAGRGDWSGRPPGIQPRS